jgi:hypothetical protein
LKRGVPDERRTGLSRRDIQDAFFEEIFMSTVPANPSRFPNQAIQQNNWKILIILIILWKTLLFWFRVGQSSELLPKTQFPGAAPPPLPKFSKVNELQGTLGHSPQ